MNCLEGFSRNTFSSTSVFRARHSAVSFMLNFLNSYRESLMTVLGRNGSSRKATLSWSGS